MRLVLFASCLLMLLLTTGGLGQDSPQSNDLGERAVQEFRKKEWAAAEQDFREVVKRDPSNIVAHIYLGQSLFRQERYAEAAVFLQKAHDLQKSGKELNATQDRILTDQLVMSYGISGNVKKAHALLDEAIVKDPQYPLNYFNLACAFAEEGNKPKALANLQLAYDRRANFLKGQQMPDPRQDSSFQRYARDPDFISLMEKFGYQ